MAVSRALATGLALALLAMTACYRQHAAVSRGSDCGNRRVGLLLLDEKSRHLGLPTTQIYDSLLMSGFHPVALNEVASRALLDGLKSTSLVVSYSAGVLKEADKAEAKLDKLVEVLAGQMSSPGLATESAVELKRIAAEFKLDMLLVVTNISISSLDFSATAILVRTDSFDILGAWSMRRYGHTAGLAIGTVFTWGLAGFGFIGAEDRTVERLMEKIAENLRELRCSR
ncbi:MAG: hypothetical protein FJX72_20815 [Armatimonadetes bacterium]|nr:hypothetical protein [Armatimonadota bacterium]